MALNNFINKYGLYVQHIDNVTVDTTKRTQKQPLLEKRTKKYFNKFTVIT